MAVKGKSPKQRDAKNVPLGDIIQEEADEAKAEQFGRDDEFDAERDLGFGAGPGQFHRSAVDKDAMVIDELLMSLPKNQGYYLKLYREIMPGKFEFKDQLNNYDTWTDLELEVCNLVKAMTRKFGAKKWGSGLYRLIIWKTGGIREKNKYPAIDVIVDAGDNEDAAANIHTGKVDPIEAANEQLGALGNMLSAVQGIMPKPVDPNVQFSAIANAFIAGKGEHANGNNQMMQMMMTMMTAMITALTQRQAGPVQESPDVQMARQLDMIKNMHAMVAPSGPGAPVKSLIEQIAELKALGIDLFKKEDTIEVLAKMKAIMSSAGEIVPGAAPVERPGIFEKLVDALAPSIPKIIGDLRTISENATIAKNVEAAKLAQNGSTQQAALAEGQELPPRPTTRYGQPIGPQPNRMSATDAFAEPPDMDPYSGFTTRPSDHQDPAGERTDEWASNFATPEQLRTRHYGATPQQQQVAPPAPIAQHEIVKAVEPQQNNAGRDDGPIDPLLQEIGNLIVNDLRDAYPNLFATLMQSTESMMMLNMAKTGAMPVETMVIELQKAGGKRMQTEDFSQRAHTYLTGFVEWMREYENGQCRVVCEMCQAIHVFESKGEFVRSPKVCSVEGGGQQCQGELTILVNDDAQKAITGHHRNGHAHE